MNEHFSSSTSFERAPPAITAKNHETKFVIVINFQASVKTPLAPKTLKL